MDKVFEVTKNNRKAVLELVKTLHLDQLNYIPAGFNNNILWNVGHIVAIQQLIVYGLGKVPFITDDALVMGFKNKTKPERPYTQEEANRIFEVFVVTADQMEADYKAGKFVDVTPFISKSHNATYEGSEGLITFNLFHEGLHTGVIQKYIQLLP
ncbi:MAG TPA: DinB family protein [Saprospiraceae bacterium]|nr:DinB family protein [Saprospiraceae bacterium]